MRRIPADRIVAEYLAQVAAASRGMRPAHREEFLDRVHDEVRERVGVGPRRDVAAVTSALAELGAPVELVAAERERLAGGLEIATRDVRRRGVPPTQAAPPRHAAPPLPAVPPVPDVLPLLAAPSAVDGLTAAVVFPPVNRLNRLGSESATGGELASRPGTVSRLSLPSAQSPVRQRSTVEMPTEPIARHLLPTAPAPAPPASAPTRRRRRGALRGVRWETAALAMLAVGPLFVGLLALLVGSAMVARSTFWDVRDKVRALVGIPAAGALFALVRAWADATHFNELTSSAARLRAAVESLVGTGGYVLPVLGLLIAARLGWLVLRDVPREETERHVGGFAG